MATKERPGCFSLIVGAGVLWALPGALLDQCERQWAVLGPPVGRESFYVGSDVLGDALPSKAILGPSGASETVEGLGDYQEEVKRRVRESAPWIIR